MIVVKPTLLFEANGREKMAHKIFISILTMTLWSGVVLAEFPDLDVEGGIPLYAALDVNAYRFQLHYAGHEYWITNSRMVQGYRSPDCLVLYSYFSKPPALRKLSALVRAIEVREGDGILFGEELSKQHTLGPKFIRGTFAYYLRDLGSYVTGLEIRVKNPDKTFATLMLELFGSDYANLRLDYSRGCKVLR